MVSERLEFRGKLNTSHGITVEVNTPGTCFIITSRARFLLHYIEELPAIIADDLNSQLLAFAESELTRELDEAHSSRLFRDELENTIRIDSETILE